MSETGAKEVKDALDDVAVRAEEISKMDPTLKVGIDEPGFARLRALNLELRAIEDLSGSGRPSSGAFRNLASQFRDIGNAADGTRLKTAALGLELRAIRDIAAGDQGGAGGGGRGGLLSLLRGFFGSGGVGRKIAGWNIPLGPLGSTSVGTVGVVGALLPAFGSIVGGTLGIIPLLASATLGVGAFGALALPTFSKVSAAITAIGAAINKTQLDRAWDAVPAKLQPVVRGVLGLQSQFAALSKIMQPLVVNIAKALLPGVSQLIGDLGPFARAVAPVLDTMAKNFSRFTMSPGFKQFLDQMLKLSPGAVAAIGEGIGKIVVAIGKLLELLVNPHALTFLKNLFTSIADVITGLGHFVQWLTTAGSAITKFAGPHIAGLVSNFAGQFDILRHAADNVGHAFDNVGHAFGNVWRALLGTWDFVVAGISGGGLIIDHVLTVDIPHAGAALLTWFAALPGKVGGFLSNLGSVLLGVGEAAMGQLWQGLKNVWNTIAGWLSTLSIHLPSAGGGGGGGGGGGSSQGGLGGALGTAVMMGMAAAMRRGSGGLLDVVADLGIRIRDRLMDAFLSSNDRTSDRAGKAIAQIIMARFQQIRQFALAIAANMVAWASLTSAATGPAFAPNPRWIHGHNVPGTGGIFSHIGSGTGTPGHHVRGHWAGGIRPVTGAALVRNLGLDLARLRRFSRVLARLRAMGLDNTLLQQIIAAGPDQGFQIAEAILDDGHKEIRALNRDEAAIGRTSRRIGITGAASQFGHGQNITVIVRGLVLADARQLAREIQKILVQLKRHNGGAALGLS